MFKFMCSNIMFCTGVFWLFQSVKSEDYVTPVVVGMIHIYASWKIYGLKI